MSQRRIGLFAVLRKCEGDLPYQPLPSDWSDSASVLGGARCCCWLLCLIFVLAAALALEEPYSAGVMKLPVGCRKAPEMAATHEVRRLWAELRDAMLWGA